MGGLPMCACVCVRVCVGGGVYWDRHEIAAATRIATCCRHTQPSLIRDYYLSVPPPQPCRPRDVRPSPIHVGPSHLISILYCSTKFRIETNPNDVQTSSNNSPTSPNKQQNNFNWLEAPQDRTLFQSS